MIRFLLVFIMFKLLSIFGYSAENTDLEHICVEIRFGEDQVKNPWDGTIEFSNTEEGNQFLYANINKGWGETSEVIIKQDIVTWNGNTTHEKVYDWAIFNNERTPGYTPEKDYMPFKPFILRVDMLCAKDAMLNVNTVNGSFTVKVADLKFQDSMNFLEGKVTLSRVFPATKITNAHYYSDLYKYHGFPAICSTPDNKTYIAFSTYYEGIMPFRYFKFNQESMPEDFSFLSQKSDGDQLNIFVEEDNKVVNTIPITNKGRDIFDIAIAADSNGVVWVVWSENVNNNLDIYYTNVVNNQPGEIKRLTSSDGPDMHPAIAVYGNKVWVAWQGFRENSYDILLSEISDEINTINEVSVGKSDANEWQPSIATDSDGRVAVAWDTYKKGDYDVYYAIYNSDGILEKTDIVAATLEFEARPSITFDKEDRLWVAYELAGKNWGKDRGSPYFIEDQAENEGLFEQRSVRVVCIDEDLIFTTSPSVEQVIPKEKRYFYYYTTATDPQRFNLANSENHYINHPVLAVDSEGRIALAYKSKINSYKPFSSSTPWETFITFYNGEQWSKPVLVYGSSGQMHEKPGICRAGNGVKIVNAADRQGNSEIDPDQFTQNIWLSEAYATGEVKPFDLEVFKPVIASQPQKALKEANDIQRVQEFRTMANGKTYRILRGDTHRHSAFSGDGGADSQIEDSHRYALDAAGLDWFSNGDHDNGYNEYYWNLTQKYTDIFHLENHHTPVFGYERSCGFPDGHRNVLFVQRGIRILPRMHYNKSDYTDRSPDTEMLYEYLNEYNGICISHTSATKTAGTDWRELNTLHEPVLEIYQGERMSAECITCPRFDGDIPYHPVNEAGTFRNALEKGHHLGVISSSDHKSTHVSYAMVYAEEFSREGIMKGLKNRSSYGATDNIILDVKLDGHLMGSVISTDNRTLEIHVVGTDEIKEIVVIKDNVEHKIKHQKGNVINTTWEDKGKIAEGQSYYYVRVLQKDGELAWSSPIWVLNQ